MPLYNYTCTNKKCERSHKVVLGKILSPKPPKNRTCPHCGGKAKRAPAPPSSRQVEVIDNGLMSRRVERISDAPRLRRERAAEADAKKD